ncbi:MAG: cryptochrome/photolyase family protein [Flavobacteriia bacterium]|nr:cryptochrome/photolyase family protein [Flavobacteriia bacterium]
MKTLRLILGDQLNTNHSWFNTPDENHVYFMAEMRQETDYVTHHIQKIVGFFAAMRSFSETLVAQGHKVVYLNLDHPDNTQDLETNLLMQINKHGIRHFEYLEPDEFRLEAQLKNICTSLDITSNCQDTEHFYTTKKELAFFFKGKKQMIMESFYRSMRKKHQVLMVADKPEGDKWNFDQDNRKKWKGTPSIPPIADCINEVGHLVQLLKKEGVNSIGNLQEHTLHWPINLEQAETVLDYFCNHLLENFGNYQDAMHSEQHFLFHSRLSFALNTKIISPKRVIDKAIDTYRNQQTDRISMNQLEGFIRQILGWREYMRGIYWKEMPAYKSLNTLENQQPLPDFYWTADTKMNCMHHAIKQSLDHAYAHHIQRLMVTGNYALLTQSHPDQVDLWYLGIYIDAIEWVELPNTRGMSQWADGGIVATKPYVSSGNYIQKMSNYCEGCHYNHKKKTGADACPFNSLYWNFLSEKEAHFSKNNRMAMMLSLLRKMDPSELSDIKKRAQHIIANPQLY